MKLHGIPIGLYLYNSARIVFQPPERLLRRLISRPNRQSKLIIWEGLKLAIPEGYPAEETWGLEAGLFEIETVDLVKKIVSHGMTCVDIGAYQGYYTLLFSKLCEDTGRVYAFEPERTNFLSLMNNVAMNNCRNVTAIQKAVCNTTGVVHFFGQRCTPTSHIVSPSHSFSDATSFGSVFLVRSVTLDEFFRGEGWPSVDLVKIDIQGAEQSALKGMRELSKKNPHLCLIVELCSHHMRDFAVTPQSFSDALRSLGFTTFRAFGANFPGQFYVGDLPRICRDLGEFSANLLCEK